MSSSSCFAHRLRRVRRLREGSASTSRPEGCICPVTAHLIQRSLRQSKRTTSSSYASIPSLACSELVSQLVQLLGPALSIVAALSSAIAGAAVATQDLNGAWKTAVDRSTPASERTLSLTSTSSGLGAAVGTKWHAGQT